MRLITILLMLLMATPAFAKTEYKDGKVIVTDTVTYKDDEGKTVDQVVEKSYTEGEINTNAANCDRIIAKLNEDKPRDYEWNVQCVEAEKKNVWQEMQKLIPKPVEVVNEDIS